MSEGRERKEGIFWGGRGGRAIEGGRGYFGGYCHRPSSSFFTLAESWLIEVMEIEIKKNRLLIMLEKRLLA